jgi:NADH-quinone oxidoreductase subunit N
MLPVTMLFAAAPKIAIFSLLAKLIFVVLLEYVSYWHVLVGFSSLGSIIVGSVSAIYQKRIKRLFAYSAIAHTGFLLLAFLSFSLTGAKSLTFYIIMYAVLTITVFAILINTAGSSKAQPKYLVNFSGIGYRNLIFASGFGLNILAIAGIPPLSGFFSKFLVIYSVIESQFFITSLVVIVFSTISCFYYLRMIKIFFFAKTHKNGL